MNLSLESVVVPVDTAMPGTVQRWLNLFVQAISIQGAEQLTGIVISETGQAPALTDQDKVWLEIDANSRPVGLNVFLGEWIKMPIAVASGTTDPTNPIAGESFYNSTTKDLTFYIDGAWKNTQHRHGTTAQRPESPALYWRYYDTDIKQEIIKQTEGWSTAWGAINQIAMFTQTTLSNALIRMPGWVEAIELRDRFMIGSGGDHNPDDTGGRSSFDWRVSKNNKQPFRVDYDNAAQNVADGIKIDGEEKAFDLEALTGSNPAEADSTVEINPPFYAVVYLRKSF